MTAYAKFMCGLADDVSTLSADDVTALWELDEETVKPQVQFVPEHV